MQARRSRVEADIAWNNLGLRKGVEPGRIGHLMNVAARIEQAE